MTDIIYKGTGENITLDVDQNSRRVKNAFNRVGVKDGDRDIIDNNAYTKTIAERGPKGANLVWHLTDHTSRMANAVGKFSELYVDRASSYLVGVTDIPKTTLGNDVLELYARGHINQHSIGFSTVKRERFNENDPANYYSIIKELKLWEGSTVLWGANDQTPNLSVGKSFKGLTGKQLIAEIQVCVEKYLEEVQAIADTLRHGKLSDQTCELLEYRMLQVKCEAKNIFDVMIATEPEAKSVQPDETESKKNHLIQLLKAQMLLS